MAYPSTTANRTHPIFPNRLAVTNKATQKQYMTLIDTSNTTNVQQCQKKDGTFPLSFCTFQIIAEKNRCVSVKNRCVLKRLNKKSELKTTQLKPATKITENFPNEPPVKK